jgi:hypothetical protein
MIMDDMIRQMRERDEMMRRLAEGPLGDPRTRELILGGANEAARALQIMDRNSVAAVMSRLATPEFAQALEMAARQASEVMERLRSPEMLEAIERANATRRALTEFAQQALTAHESMARQLGAMALQIDTTLKALPTIDFERIGSLVALAETPRARLGMSTQRLVVRHTEYVEALALPESTLYRLPESMQQLPTQDVFVHTGAVRSLSPHEPVEPEVEKAGVDIRVEVSATTSVFLEATIPVFHAPFLEQYRGAKARSVDRGPDAWTQGGASLRKLLKGVLHRAAPNELVLPWAQANKMELDRNGRPTRATKVAWLCEPVANNAYRAFVRTELDATLAVIELLDASQHLDEFPDFQDKYDWVLLRVEMAVRQILELWKLRL